MLLIHWHRFWNTLFAFFISFSHFPFQINFVVYQISNLKSQSSTTYRHIFFSFLIFRFDTFYDYISYSFFHSHSYFFGDTIQPNSNSHPITQMLNTSILFKTKKKRNEVSTFPWYLPFFSCFNYRDSQLKLERKEEKFYLGDIFFTHTHTHTLWNEPNW